MANADVGERMKALRRNALILVSVIGVAISVVLVVVFSDGPGPAGAPPHDITIVSPEVAPYSSWDNLTAHLANGGSVTVTWYNADVNIHSVVSDTGLFQSPMIAPGEHVELHVQCDGDVRVPLLPAYVDDRHDLRGEHVTDEPVFETDDMGAEAADASQGVSAPFF